MPETLRQKQSRFAQSYAHLVIYAQGLGYHVTHGETLRSDEQAEINAIGAAGRATLAKYLRSGGWNVLAAKIENNVGSGIRSSLHELKLAGDLNLYDAAGNYQADGTSHTPLGLWWEAQGPDYRWGGRFGDPNHYSIEHEGRK